MHVVVAMGGAKNDPGTVAYGLARAWSLAGVPALVIDVDPDGCTLDFRLGNAVSMALDPISRGLPSLVGGGHPFSVETISDHTYGLDGNSKLWVMLGPVHPRGSQIAAEYVFENLDDLKKLSGNLKVVVNAGRIPTDAPINPAVRPLIDAAEPLLVIDSFSEDDDGETVPSFMGENPVGEAPKKSLWQSLTSKEKEDGYARAPFPKNDPAAKAEALALRKAQALEKREEARKQRAKAKERAAALRKDAAARKEAAYRKKTKSYELLMVADGNFVRPETVEIRVLSRIPPLPDMRALAKPRGLLAKRWNAGIGEAVQQIDLMFAPVGQADTEASEKPPGGETPKVVEVQEVTDAASWWRRRRGRSDVDIVDVEEVEVAAEVQDEEAVQDEAAGVDESAGEETVESAGEEIAVRESRGRGEVKEEKVVPELEEGKAGEQDSGEGAEGEQDAEREGERLEREETEQGRKRSKQERQEAEERKKAEREQKKLEQEQQKVEQREKAEQERERVKQERKEVEERKKAEREQKKLEQEQKKVEQREKAEQERERVKQERKEAEERKKAEREQKKLEQERKKAEQEQQKAERKRKKLEQELKKLEQ